MGTRFFVWLMLALIVGMQVVLAEPNANSLSVSDAVGSKGATVVVPVEIIKVRDKPIAGIGFEVHYNREVIVVKGLRAGNLTSNWDLGSSYSNHPWGTKVVIVYNRRGFEIPLGSTGSVVLLEFDVVGDLGYETEMSLSGIQLSDTEGNLGTASAQEGMFTVTGDVTRLNTSTTLGNGSNATDGTEPKTNCFDGVKNCHSGGCEENVDCGGPCEPCPNCSDGIKNGDETGIDCGGFCDPCPWIKAESRGYPGENLSIVVMNPRTGLRLRIKNPSGGVEEYNVSRRGLETYQLVVYRPESVGVHLLELVGYEEKYVNVRRKSIVSIIDDIPEEVRSLFVPLVIVALFLFWLSKRRTKVVLDESAIKKFIEEEPTLLKKYGKVYTTAELLQGFAVGGIVHVELSDAQMDEAEKLMDRYGILLPEAKSLVLCRRLRAKKLITGVEFPEEIRENFMGSRIVRVGG